MAVDYVSKWVEALPCVAADSKSSNKMFQEIIFPCFGVPRVVISNGGSHFIDKTFRKCLSELGVDHRVVYTIPSPNKRSGRDVQHAN